MGKSLKGASLFIEFCDFFHFAENFNLISFLGDPIIKFLVNFCKKTLYDFFRWEKKINNMWVNAKKVHQYL